MEAFHALTDGTGGLTFLMTLVAVYLHKKQDMPMEAGRYVLDINTPSEQEELEDSFPRYRGEFGQMAKESKAYHPRGTLIASHLLLVITGVMSVDDVRRKAEKYSCSITVFLTALMIFALQKQQEMERRKKKPIRISIPVNLRTRFPSKTLRNFSYWINLGINAQYGHYTLDEIIRLVQAHLQIGLDPKQLCARFTGTLSAAEHPLFRTIPLFLKHWILNVGDVLMGDASCSQSLSNLGSVDVPDPMKPYLCVVRFLLGRSRGKAGSGSCVSYHDKLALSFTRKIHESAFERLFFSSLVEMGTPVEIESNRLR